MSNEWIFLISLIVNIAFVTFCARRGKEWLFGSIVVNLIFIGIFGTKLIDVFGFVTNAGNVFYACVFLATHFLIEKYGRHDGLRTVWIGGSFMVFFLVMSQLVTEYIGIPQSQATNSAINALFSYSPRAIVASVAAYIFAQYINVSIFSYLKERTRDKSLWLRSNAANIVSQLADSLLFFSIAFFDAPGPLLVQMILVGWLVKTFVVMVATPFLYSVKLK